MKLSCGSKTTLLVFGFCFVGFACLCRADAIFENVQGSAEVLFPPDGGIFYVQNPGDYRTITATGRTEISYTVTTDVNVSVLHTYRITASQGTLEGDQICRYPANTTKFESVEIGPDILTLTRDCGFGEHLVGVYHQAVNCTTGQIIATGSDLHSFKVKVIPATATGGFQPLGVLPGYSGTNAYGISADGSTVVGYCSRPSAPGSLELQAFRWKNGTMTGLGCLPGYPPNSMAFGVSADGSVVVGLSGPYPEYISSRYCWAFRWANGTMSALPAPVIPDYNTADCSARGVSADGSVVVGNVVGSDSLHSDLSDACRWDGSVFGQPVAVPLQQLRTSRLGRRLGRGGIWLRRGVPLGGWHDHQGRRWLL